MDKKVNLFKKGSECLCTWTIGHRVKVAVGEHQVLAATLGLQPDGDVGDTVIKAGESSKKVNGERARWTLHVYRELMSAGCRLHSDALYLLQQVTHRQDLILLTAHWPRANAGDLLQVPS